MSAENKLIAAVKRGNVAAVAAALATGPSDRAWATGVNDAVHVACLHGRANCLRLLLAAGADPNAESSRTDDDSWRLRYPIHKAVQAGHVGCVAALLENDANPCAKCFDGRTALDTAICEASGDSAQLLLAEAELQPVNEITARLIETMVRFDTDGEHNRLRRLAPAVPVLLARLDLPLDTGNGHYTFQRYRSLMVSSTLARWLPVMLRRSDAAAAQLVAFLPPPDRERLRTHALCLVRYQRSLSARLPGPIAGRLLALAAAQHAQQVTTARRANVAIQFGSVASKFASQFASQFPKRLALLVVLAGVVGGFFYLVFTGFRPKK